MIVVEAGAAFQGPIPPPAVLAQYDEIRPDLVDRIVGMAERQQDHRHHVEKKIVDASIARSKWGQVCGLTVGLAGLVAAVVCVALGSAVTGSIIGAVDLVALVSVFVYGSRQSTRRRTGPHTEVIDVPAPQSDEPPRAESAKSLRKK